MQEENGKLHTEKESQECQEKFSGEAERSFIGRVQLLQAQEAEEEPILQKSWE